MVNQLLAVGRIIENPKLKESEDGKKYTNITLEVPRSYKNSNGEYDTDFIDCTLKNDVAEKVCEYCRKGDLISVKGRVNSKVVEKDGKNFNTQEVLISRVTFLSSVHKKEELELVD